MDDHDTQLSGDDFINQYVPAEPDAAVPDKQADEMADDSIAEADLADWPAADKLLWEKAKDVGLNKMAYGKARASLLSITPERTSPGKRMEFLSLILGRAFDRDGNRAAALT